MVKRVRAIYEQGVFRPLEPVEGLADGTAVWLHVEADVRDGGSLSDFAGIWTEEDANEIAAIVAAEFGRIDPCEEPSEDDPHCT